MLGCKNIQARARVARGNTDAMSTVKKPKSFEELQRKSKVKDQEMSLPCSSLTRMASRRMSVKNRNERSAKKCIIKYEDAVKNESKDQSGRAKKLDGGYFEEFTHLDEKQDELIKEAAHETLKKEALAIHDTCHGQIYTPPEKEQALVLYKELVYTIMHRLGKKKQGGDSLTDGEIYAHGQQVLKISAAEHKQIYNEVKVMEAPLSFLNVQVLAGNELDAKDANGLSDPYCMLCLINSGEGDHGKKEKKKLLRELKQERDVKLTKIKLRTLNPEWKQEFKFVVSDISNQVLRIDVWDKDDNTVVLDADNKITSIKGFRGASRFFKEIAQSSKGKSDTLDDFMGLIEIPLKNILEDGLDAWFRLEPRSSKKTVGGRIHLKLSFSARHPEEISSNSSNRSSSNEIYNDFVNYFSRYDCENAVDIEPGACWDCVLMDTSTSLLLQYRTQREISLLQSTVIFLQVYSRLYEDVNLRVEFIDGLLQSYRVQVQTDELNTKEDEEQFVNSLNRFSEHVLKLLEKHRYIYSTVEPGKCNELGKLLMVLLLIYKLPSFQQHFPDRRMKSDIEEAIVKGTTEWFGLMAAFTQTMEKSPNNLLSHLVNFTNIINADLTRGEENYAPVFNVIRVSYLTIVFNKLETLLSNLIENGTKNLDEALTFPSKCNDDIGTRMFELYLAVRTFHGFKTKLNKEDLHAGGIDNYSNWFKKGVLKWLEMATIKAGQRIVKAVDLEEVRVIDSMVKHSTSAVDVSCCLGQICEFWKRLDWPDPDGAFMFLTQITDIVGKCAMDYAEIILKQLHVKGFYDDEGQFDVTDQFLDYVPIALNYQNVLKEMAVLHGEDRVLQLEQTLNDILNCAKDDMKNKLEHIFEHIVTKMKVTLTSFMLKAIKSTQDIVVATDPLLEYIDSNLVTLSETLLEQVFESILVRFWEMLISSLQDLTKSNEKKLQQIHFKRLDELLGISLGYFHGDGNGINFEILMSDTYKSIVELINLNKSTTEELIERFFIDRCHAQDSFFIHIDNTCFAVKSLALVKIFACFRKYFVPMKQKQENASPSTLGSLTFKAFYCNRTNKLNVYVMNCKQLLPMDKNGSSDPYVILRLLPNHLFTDNKSQKTKVKKNTLFPLFDESFQFDIPSPDDLKPGTCLVFTIYDQDRLSDDDIAGEVYYDLQNVVGLTSETVQGSFSTVPQIEMPLIIGGLDSETMRVLKIRKANDPVAESFVQKQKQRRKSMEENLRKAQQLRAADRK